MKYEVIRIFLLSALSLTAAACAGPTTPFGALDGLLPAQLQRLSAAAQAVFTSEKNQAPEIRVTPDRQVLHDRSQPRISIFDPEGIPTTAVLRAYFNGYDVSDKVFKNATYDLHPKARDLVVEFRHLRIPAGKEKTILFTYQRAPDADTKGFHWKFPECPFDQHMAITDLGKFATPDQWVRWIEKTATENKLNPSLMAGLVAQESAFNPKAISWAKAIGLTQITPVADRELATVGSAWHRSKAIDRYPAPIIKTLIVADKLTDRHDYRLHPQYSLEAGAQYLNYLRGFWELEEHKTLLADKLSADSSMQSKVILASYNSGASRVKRAIQERGTDFLHHSELTEARKYVSRTSSYCYHFANAGGVQ